MRLNDAIGRRQATPLMLTPVTRENLESFHGLWALREESPVTSLPLMCVTRSTRAMRFRYLGLLGNWCREEDLERARALLKTEPPKTITLAARLGRSLSKGRPEADVSPASDSRYTRTAMRPLEAIHRLILPTASTPGVPERTSMVVSAFERRPLAVCPGNQLYSSPRRRRFCGDVMPQSTAGSRIRSMFAKTSQNHTGVLRQTSGTESHFAPNAWHYCTMRRDGDAFEGPVNTV